MTIATGCSLSEEGQRESHHEETNGSHLENHFETSKHSWHIGSNSQDVWQQQGATEGKRRSGESHDGFGQVDALL